MGRLKKFMALEARNKLLLLRAWCMLGCFRAIMLALPLKRLTRGLQHHPGPVVPAALGPQQQQEARTIGAMVAAAASITPWQSRCLLQVLVVQRLLAARGVLGHFYLGVCRNPFQGMAVGDIAAHAWLQCGDLIVSGAAGHEQYTVISTYSWKLQANSK